MRQGYQGWAIALVLVVGIVSACNLMRHTPSRLPEVSHDKPKVQPPNAQTRTQRTSRIRH
jgi:hypothetical protein